MKSTEQKNDDVHTIHGHTCPPGHCCDCNGCNSGWMGHHGMRAQWGRHFLVLVLGVIAAFYVGMKIGELKGYLMNNGNDMMPMYHHGWMMQDRGMVNYGVTIPAATPSPVPTPATAAQPAQ